MSFITPLFLIAAGAALLPVLAHLVRRRQTRRIPFSSLMLVQASPKAVVRRRRLKDILLLVIRATMLVLLALAFARPFIPEESLPFLPERENESLVLLIDRSLSMQAYDRFEDAQRLALRRIDNAGANDEIAVVGFSDTAEQLTELSDDAALHRGVIASLLPLFRTTDFHAPLRLAADILLEARHEDRTVVLISDYQRSGFTGALENYSIPDGITVVTESVADARDENSFFEAFDLSMRRAADTVSVDLSTRVRNDGPESAVQLWSDGERVDERDLPALTSAAASFRHLATRMGYFQGSLRLSEDALQADNTYFFTYRVAARPVVLVVDTDPDLRNAFFLRTAFELGAAAQFTFRQSSRLTSSALTDVNVVFAADFPTLSQVEIALLERFATAGGGVILSFGPNTDLEGYASALRQLGIAGDQPMEFRQSEAGEDFLLGRIDDRHPVFAPFARSGTGAMLRPKFRRYVRLIPDSTATVPAAYNSGDPFLLEKRQEAGRLLAFTSTLSTLWTDLPLSGVFVPLLHHAAAHSFETAAAQEQYVIGDVVSLPGTSGDVWDVRAPDGNVYKVDVDEAENGFFRETEQPGHYVAVQESRRFPFSVNTDPAESLLELRDEEEAYAAVAGRPGVLAPTPEEAALVLQDEEREQKLWRAVIMLLIGLFFLETWLANRPQLHKTQRQNA